MEMDGFSTLGMEMYIWNQEKAIDVVLVTGNLENATLEWKLGRVTLDCNIYKSGALNHQ